MRRHHKSEGFNLAFLDIMACGLGAVILVFMLVKHNANDLPVEPDLLQRDIQQLEQQQQELQQLLTELKNVATSDSIKNRALKTKLTDLKRAIAQKNATLTLKRKELNTLKKDIATTPLAQSEDRIADERSGEENYLMGLKVEGRRIAILVDSSASMTDATLLEIIKRKNSSDQNKKQGPKWRRTRNIVRWLLARTPKDSQVAVIYFNGDQRAQSLQNWLASDNSETIKHLYNQLDTIIPKGGTNLQQGLKSVSQLGPTDLYLITDGLPTTGDSRYGSLNPFARCSSLRGTSSSITGECRVKLFRQTIKESSPANTKINVILLPIEGDPDAINEYWSWAALTGGLVISPAENWP